ncbi:MAG: hypothetical protein HQ500_12075 [Flavobacteriales bacterium]|nr:hypothetical protein [Flavobacteriales bacterium]
MRVALVICILLGLSGISFGQEEGSDPRIYFFNPSHLKSSIRQEVGMSIGTHWTKSPMRNIYTSVDDGVAYPEPVFSRAIGILAGTYEPRLRLIEYKSNASISLDIPLTLSFSLVDVLSGSRYKYSAEPLTEQELASNIFSKERDGILGICHAEAGALLSVNIGQGSTIENTKMVGWTLSAGYNLVRGPLFMNFIENYDRADYKKYLGWGTPVARVGIHAEMVVVYYMLGIAPTRVNYQTGSTFDVQTEMTNTYNRLSLSFRLGR